MKEKRSGLQNIKATDVKLKIGGRERQIKFGFSAWAKLEEKYGGVKNIENLEKDIQEKPFVTIPFLIWIGLQDKEGVNEKTVLDEYGLGDLEKISKVLYSALYGSLPQGEEAVEKKTEQNS